MGCVSSIGLGLALTQRDKDIIVIDGDGSLLMRMGSLATIGYSQPNNLLHIVLDNNTHDSTGGQHTVSNNVEFTKVAASCGYGKALFIHDLYELENCIKKWKNDRGLTFLYLKISRGSKPNLGRPTLKPNEVKERLQSFLFGSCHFKD
jgi:phosphonopyruvate decarboxylase